MQIAFITSIQFSLLCSALLCSALLCSQEYPPLLFQCQFKFLNFVFPICKTQVSFYLINVIKLSRIFLGKLDLILLRKLTIIKLIAKTTATTTNEHSVFS